MDAETTNCLISLICRYKSLSSVKKIGGHFAALLIWREATIVVMAGSAACAHMTSSWHVSRECGLTDGLFGHCTGDGVHVGINFCR
uniref:Uncharacterized protein n=1 Tax=Romanomermis culicivorax TaxID=13658 RepID=A0A915IBZ1_ROMCU